MIADKGGQVFLSIINAIPSSEHAFPANVIAQPTILNEESFPTAFPLSLGRSKGYESSFGGFCVKTSHQGEGSIHREVFSREWFKSHISIAGDRSGNFDTLGGWIPGSGQVNEGR